MTGISTAAGYQQTREKLARLQQRLANLERRTDLDQQHQMDAKRSCMQMIAQYRRELKLYEAFHPEIPSKP